MKTFNTNNLNAKDKAVIAALNALVKSKAKQERIASQIAIKTDDPILRQLMEAVNKSCRIMAEELLKEAGYKQPQSENTYKFLQTLSQDTSMEEPPKYLVENLLAAISNQEAMDSEYKCL
jgi:hypothetical protein